MARALASLFGLVRKIDTRAHSQRTTLTFPDPWSVLAVEPCSSRACLQVCVMNSRQSAIIYPVGSKHLCQITGAEGRILSQKLSYAYSAILQGNSKQDWWIFQVAMRIPAYVDRIGSARAVMMLSRTY